MRPCEECGANDFKFSKDGETTLCRCQACGNELRLTSKYKTPHPCPECQGEMKTVKVKVTAEMFRSGTYYLANLQCKCGHIEPKLDTKVRVL